MIFQFLIRRVMQGEVNDARSKNDVDILLSPAGGITAECLTLEKGRQVVNCSFTNTLFMLNRNCYAIQKKGRKPAKIPGLRLLFF